MQPKELHVFGPEHDAQAFLVVVPSIEHGHFRAEFASYIDIGQLAIIKDIEIVAARQIAEGDEELLESYYEMESPGRYVMQRGTSVSVVNGSQARQSMTENVVKAEAQYSSRWLEEFEPYISPKYKIQ